MKFACWTFRLAGIYGLLVILPLYFAEQRLSREFPPPITHPEHYYDFVGVALAWQVAFLLVAQDPVRFRHLMLLAVMEKPTYVLALAVLFFLHRVPPPVLAPAAVDLLLATLFLLAFWKTRLPRVPSDK